LSKAQPKNALVTPAPPKMATIATRPHARAPTRTTQFHNSFYNSTINFSILGTIIFFQFYNDFLQFLIIFDFYSLLISQIISQFSSFAQPQGQIPALAFHNSSGHPD
jgi:hypothetical protein